MQKSVFLFTVVRKLHGCGYNFGPSINIFICLLENINSIWILFLTLSYSCGNSKMGWGQ